jgi:hypothetical protein
MLDPGRREFLSKAAMAAGPVAPRRTCRRGRIAAELRNSVLLKHVGALALAGWLTRRSLEAIATIWRVRSVVSKGRMYDCGHLWQFVGLRP